jgi:hypothetical protein
VIYNLLGSQLKENGEMQLLAEQVISVKYYSTCIWKGYNLSLGRCRLSHLRLCCPPVCPGTFRDGAVTTQTATSRFVAFASHHY